MEPLPQAPLWLTASVAIIVFGGLGALAYLLYARQRAGLAAFAQRHGWKYAPDNELGWVAPASLDEHGLGPVDAASIRHLLRGNVDGREACLFEFRRFGARDRQVGYTKVMAAYALPPGWNEDHVAILPRRRLGRLLPPPRSVSGEERPFVRRYSVTGDDPALQRLLPHPARRLLLTRRPWVVLFDTQYLVLYRPVRWWQRSGLRPKVAEKLLRESLELHRALIPRAPH